VAPDHRSFRFSDHQRRDIQRVLTKRHQFPTGRFHGGEAVTQEVVVARLENPTEMILAGKMNAESWRTDPATRERAELEFKRSRGQPRKLTRLGIVNTIAGILVSSGVRLTKYVDGELGRITMIVLEAAKLGEPGDSVLSDLIRRVVAKAKYDDWVDLNLRGY